MVAVLLVPALYAGLRDRRTRSPVVITASLAALWTLVPTDAAFIHDFWNLMWLLPAALGTAAFADLVAAKLSDRSIRALAATAAVAVVTALVGVATGELRGAVLRIPAEAGALLQQVTPLPLGSNRWRSAPRSPCPVGRLGGGGGPRVRDNTRQRRMARPGDTGAHPTR